MRRERGREGGGREREEGGGREGEREGGGRREVEGGGPEMGMVSYINIEASTKIPMGIYCDGQGAIRKIGIIRKKKKN